MGIGMGIGMVIVMEIGMEERMSVEHFARFTDFLLVDNKVLKIGH